MTRLNPGASLVGATSFEAGAKQLTSFLIFSSGDDSKHTVINDNTVAHAGNQYLEINNSAGGLNYRTVISGSDIDRTLILSFRFTAFSSTTHNLIQCGASLSSLEVTSAGVLTYFPSGTSGDFSRLRIYTGPSGGSWTTFYDSGFMESAASQSAGTISTGTWYTVIMEVRNTNANSKVGDWTIGYLGVVAAGGKLLFDDISSWKNFGMHPYPPFWTSKLMTAEGTSTGWTSSSGGNKWDDINEGGAGELAPNDATDYITRSATGPQSFTFGGTGLTAGTEIWGIAAFFRNWAATGVGVVTGVIQWSDGTSTLSSGVSANVWTTVGIYRTTSGDKNWLNLTEVNAIELGVSAVGSTNERRCSHIVLEVLHATDDGTNDYTDKLRESRTQARLV